MSKHQKQTASNPPATRDGGYVNIVELLNSKSTLRPVFSEWNIDFGAYDAYGYEVVDIIYENGKWTIEVRRNSATFSGSVDGNENDTEVSIDVDVGRPFTLTVTLTRGITGFILGQQEEKALMPLDHFPRYINGDYTDMTLDDPQSDENEISYFEYLPQDHAINSLRIAAQADEIRIVLPECKFPDESRDFIIAVTMIDGIDAPSIVVMDDQNEGNVTILGKSIPEITANENDGSFTMLYFTELWKDVFMVKSEQIEWI